MRIVFLPAEVNWSLIKGESSCTKWRHPKQMRVIWNEAKWILQKWRWRFRVLNVFMSQWSKKPNPTAATLSRKTPPHCFVMLDFKIEAPEGFRLQSVTDCALSTLTLFHFSLSPKKRTVGNQKVNMQKYIYYKRNLLHSVSKRFNIYYSM